MKGKIGILVGPKTSGSNMQAIAVSCAGGTLSACVTVVIAPSEESPAYSLARSLGLNATVVTPGTDTYGEELVKALSECNLVCLAGFLRLLPSQVLEAFPHRVINIHPAIDLHRFGGKGMYGLNVHKAVLEAGVSETGCTVHYVTPEYDSGAIIRQARVPVLSGDTPETLAARVLAEEHRLYPSVIAEVFNGA